MNQNVRQLTASSVRQFESYLHREGKKKSTIEKYLRDVKAFRTWLRHERTAKETEEMPEDTENSAEDSECSDEEAKISDPELCCVFGSGTVTKESARRWRDVLCKRGYAPVTVNAMLTSLNLLFRFLGWEECRAKTLRIQRCFFRSSERELQRREYECLIRTAKAQEKERLALLIETMGATGIRVSEVKAVTVEAVRCGRAEISLKGKIRTILIEEKLRKKLLRYAEKRDIICGEIFVTRSGNSLSRQQIWAEMK